MMSGLGLENPVGKGNSKKRGSKSVVRLSLSLHAERSWQAQQDETSVHFCRQNRCILGSLSIHHLRLDGA